MELMQQYMSIREHNQNHEPDKMPNPASFPRGTPVGWKPAVENWVVVWQTSPQSLWGWPMGRKEERGEEEPHFLDGIVIIWPHLSRLPIF